MNEEKKNQKSEEQKSPAQEAPQEKSQASAARKPSTEEAKPKPAVAPPKKERPNECIVCNKNIQKQWYYREGNYYCGKGCWKKSKKAK